MTVAPLTRIKERAVIKRIRFPEPALRIRATRPSPRKASILDAINDSHLFRPWFEKDAESWQGWFAFLAALFALEMSADQLAFYRQCTGRDDPPTSMVQEAWLVCGRRAGKSFVLALIAVYLSAFFDWKPHLSRGENGFIVIVAADRRQARTIFRYLRALLLDVPMLAELVAKENAESIELTNGIIIEVATCSYRTVRGRTIIAALCDEVAFWSGEDSAEPDIEVLNALRPGMATVPGAMLLCASSPYSRRGALWDAHRKHFGKNGDPVLCWQAATRTMNSTVPQAFIDAEVEKDPANAQAEYFAQFRTDVEALLTREAIEACVSAGAFERGRAEGITYAAFCDPSGGSADSMTLAVAHLENGMHILDAVRERKPPFSPEVVVKEFAALLKSYGISRVLGDRYAGEWVKEPFKLHGIAYEAAAKPKSDLYRDFLPIVNSKKVDLLDHARLTQQLIGLERRTARSGKDSIDHAPNGHDDVANAVAGAITNLGKKKYAYDSTLAWVSGDDANEAENFRVGRISRYLFNGGFFR